MVGSSLITIPSCVLSSSILHTLLVDHPAWTIGFSLVALILLGRAKPVRAMGRFAPRVWENFPGLRPWLTPRPQAVHPVEHRPVSLYRGPGPVRRFAALVSTAALGIVIGVVAAVLLSALAIWLVGSVTGRLK